MRMLVIGGLSIALCGAAAAAPQSRDDAWWTGPMLAPSGATLPAGHVLVEPYLYDVITRGHFDDGGTHRAGPDEHDLGSLTYLLYGLTDRLTLGIIPRFGYNQPAGAPDSSGVGVGDFTAQAAYGLTQYQDGRAVPAIALVIGETFPTGRYDSLGRASDGFGGGVYATAVSLYSQDYFWMPTGRILRARLDLTYTISSSVRLRDRSVYGTPDGFRGEARPGGAFGADLAAEYSLTRHWVLAADLVYQYSASTLITGSHSSTRSSPGTGAPPGTGSPPGTAPSAIGASWSLGVAPAVEYNFSSTVGVLLGIRIIGAGRNTSSSITPAIAVNLVR